MAFGASRSVSRVPGAPPPTSTPPTAPSRVSTTVVPVVQPSSSRWWWPTSMPATSVMALHGPGPLGTSASHISASSAVQEASGRLGEHLRATTDVGHVDELVGLMGDPLAARAVHDARDPASG